MLQRLICLAASLFFVVYKCSSALLNDDVNGPQNVDGACLQNCRPIFEEICKEQQKSVSSATHCECPVPEENALKIDDKNAKFLNLDVLNEISKSQRMENVFGNFGEKFKFIGKMWKKGRKWWLKNGQKWSENVQKMKKRCLKIEEHFFQQRVDHFGESSEAEGAKKTFEQLYQINWCMFDPTKWPSASPVVLLLIGGEPKIYPEFIKGTHLPLMEMAGENGAVIVQLEHRFFGKKVENLGPYTVENLRLVLTVEQALADISAFIDHFNRKHLKGIGRGQPRWILIGISYSEWSMTIENNIKSVDQNCFDVLKSTISKIFLKRRTRQGIEELLWHYGDHGTSLPETILYIWSDITQKPCHDFLITYKSACTILTDESMIREHRLIKLISEWAMECGKMEKYKKALENAENKNIDENETARIFYPDVLWKPMELMNIQPGNLTSGYHAISWAFFKRRTITMEYLERQFHSCCQYSHHCINYWPKIDSQYIEKQILEMWKKYGDGCSYRASNILFVNGSFDPWTALSYQRECRNKQEIKMDEENGMHSIIIEGAFHLDNFYFSRKEKGELPGVEQAQKKIRETKRFGIIWPNENII